MLESAHRRLRAAVVTNRGFEIIRPCLEGLAAQGLSAGAIVGLSGLQPVEAQQRRAAIESVLPGVTVLTVARPGANLARAAVLSAADDGDILAFIDDDAAPGPAWSKTLHSAWAGAGPDVGAIGGPVRPLFLAPRPRWMSDYLVGGLSIIDFGPDPTELSPETGFLYLANLSIDVAHTRRIGGFDTSLGPVGGTAGFGDDIELQRSMVSAGLRVLYAPEAWVEHRIPAARLKRRPMLDRRYRNGLDYARKSQTPRARLAVSIGWCILAGLTDAVRGRSSRAMDRFAYAAQCVGEVRRPRRRD
jgi:hypothetical protein